VPRFTWGAQYVGSLHCGRPQVQPPQIRDQPLPFLDLRLDGVYGILNLFCVQFPAALGVVSVILAGDTPLLARLFFDVSHEPRHSGAWQRPAFSEAKAQSVGVCRSYDSVKIWSQSAASSVRAIRTPQVLL
jgi:hypothetical protein